MLTGLWMTNYMIGWAYGYTVKGWDGFGTGGYWSKTWAWDTLGRSFLWATLFFAIPLLMFLSESFTRSLRTFLLPLSCY